LSTHSVIYEHFVVFQVGMDLNRCRKLRASTASFRISQCAQPQGVRATVKSGWQPFLQNVRRIRAVSLQNAGFTSPARFILEWHVLSGKISALRQAIGAGKECL
jgi:hypothetical protein